MTPASSLSRLALTSSMAVALFALGCTNPLDVGLSKTDAAALGGVDARGNDLCMDNGWYGDDECDEFCPDADPDCSVTSCNPVTCELVCENGFVRGADGCETCSCAPGKDPVCPGDPGCPVTCDTSACTIDCQYGYVKDETGCQLCECLPAPACDGLDQQTCAATAGCLPFCALDETGPGSYTGCFDNTSTPPPNQALCAPPSATIADACPSTPSDGFELGKATLDGDLLRLTVSYGGGCEEHVFSFCWDGSFLESNPVQAPLGIHHEGNDDACDAYITEEITVDLSSMKQAYQAGYQTKTGTIILRLGETGQSLSYEF